MTKYCLKMIRRITPNAIHVIGSSIGQPMLNLKKLAVEMTNWEFEYWVDVWTE